MHASATLIWKRTACVPRRRRRGRSRPIRAAKRARKRAWNTRGRLHAPRCSPQPWYKPCSPGWAERARWAQGLAHGNRDPTAAPQAKVGHGSQTAPQTIPPCGPGRSSAHQGPLVKVGREGPAAHLQPPVRKSVSTSQVATARLWCRRWGATILMVSAHPQEIASAPRHLVLPAIPMGDVSAPAPMNPTGSTLVRHVQEAHQEHSGKTRVPTRIRTVTKPAMFW